MEHFKKRLIHQLEKPQEFPEASKNTPQNSKDHDKESEDSELSAKPFGDTQSNGDEEMLEEKSNETENSTSLEVANTAGLDKKKEVIHKVARRKSVSRSQFRHDNIPLYKLGTSEYKINFITKMGCSFPFQLNLV